MSLEVWRWIASITLWLFFTGIGIPPVPEEAGILYAAGVATLHPEVQWWMAWPATALGILAADTVLYGTGRLWGRHVFDFAWLKRILAPERRERIENRLHEHGTKLLLMARLLPPLRTGVFLIAGAIHFSFMRFLLADVIYGIVGVGLFFFCGQGIIALVHRAGHWLVVLAALALGGFILYRYYHYLKKVELKAAVQVLATAAPEAVAPAPVASGTPEANHELPEEGMIHGTQPIRRPAQAQDAAAGPRRT